MGLPLGATFKDIKVWNGVIAQMQRKLARWKGKYLYKGLKMTLIRRTLASISTYFMSLHIILILVAKKIEEIQRDFLWGCDEGVHRYQLVSWDVIC